MSSILIRFSRAFAALALVAGLVASSVPVAAFAQVAEDQGDRAAEVITEPVVEETPSPEVTTFSAGQTQFVPSVVADTVTNETEFRAAIAEPTIPTITLANDFSVTSAVVVDRAVTIEGNGKTVTAGFDQTSTSNNSILLILASGVTVNNLTADGNHRNVHGINVYQATSTNLDGVTAKNSKAGIIVNGSEVIVNNVTTSGNLWGGINVDQGSGVTTAATLTVNGVSTHSESGPAVWKDDNSKTGVSVVDTASQYTAVVQPVNATQGTLYYLSTVKNESELNAALSNANIPVITLGSSFTVAASVAVNRAVTIEGNGKTVTAGFDQTSTSNNSTFLITGPNVTIKNLTEDGNSHNVHGIQAYATTNVSLEGVTVKNNGRSGLLVNGSTVTVTDLATSGNVWNGVNVDRGSGVTTEAKLTVNGTSSHGETVAAIWIDDSTKSLVSVVDTNAQYDASAKSYVSGAVTIVGTEYFLKPAVVTEPVPTGTVHRSGGSGGSSSTGTTGSTGTGTGGGQVLGASTYNFTVDLTIGSTGADVTALQQLLIDAGLLKIAAPTGWFGPMTQAALKLWQAAHGVPATGYFGPLTRAAIAASGTPVSTMTEAERAALIKKLLEQVLELQKKLDDLN